jgi:hypothetical protein
MMRAVDIIVKKRDGGELDRRGDRVFVRGYSGAAFPIIRRGVAWRYCCAA